MKLTSTTTRQTGFVLITVLLIVVLLTAVLLQYNVASRTLLAAADSYHDRTQALNLARTGLNIALAAINRNPDLHTNETLRQMLNAPYLHKTQTGRCTVNIESENGKLNLNRLHDQQHQLDRARIEQLLRLIELLNQVRRDQGLPPISPGLVPALIDWIDPDDQTTILPFFAGASRGAESDDYKKAGRPYPCKNRPLDTLDELLLLPDVPPDATLDPEAINPDQPDNHDYRMSRHLTIYGDGKIDINTASPLVLQSLSEYITPAQAELIVQHRREKPFTSIDRLSELTGFQPDKMPALSGVLTLKPTVYCYTITARARAGSAQTAVTALVRKNSTSNNVEILLYREY